MKTLFIQKITNKYQQVKFIILERVAVEYNGVKGFQNEEMGYEFENEEAAKSKLAFLSWVHR
jgi:hypothetical protein